jgi:hypothetical protein
MTFTGQNIDFPFPKTPKAHFGKGFGILALFNSHYCELGYFYGLWKQGL